MSSKKKHRTIPEYIGYLKGELSATERHALERDLEADAFEKEAMEGFEMITPGELEEDLLTLHSRLRKRQQKRRRVTLYSIAATVASLLVVGTIFINIYDFNPKADRETDQVEESLMMEKSPEPSEAKETTAAKKLDAPADKEELSVPEQEREMAAAVVAEEPVREPVMEDLIMDEAEEELAGVAAPQMAREEVPEIAEEMAPAPEADAVLAVEAAPTRRQKRAQSKVRTEVSAMDQEKATQSLIGKVSGVVISAEDMDPLPGATVMVRGLTSGYVSDMEGRFTVPAGEEAQTIVVASYVGMVTEEYQLDPDQENRVLMQPDQSTLNEVVVVANPDYEVFKGAEPVGGIEAYKIYVEKNIRFPAGDTLSKREIVILKFTVNPDGSLSGILSLRSPGDAFTEEAIRLLEEGPLWNPAQGETGTTDDEVRMRIVFKK